MSKEYDLYLEQHKLNVRKGFYWIKENIPEAVNDYAWNDELEQQICYNHDASKSEPDEYFAYDRYFYGNNRSSYVVDDFNHAWLRHIHRNPHHWQHWVLINDNPDEGEIILDMPYNYILEMVCDWWAFSWRSGNLTEIFNWYDQHKDYMKLSKNTRGTVDILLKRIKNKLDEVKRGCARIRNARPVNIEQESRMRMAVITI